MLLHGTETTLGFPCCNARGTNNAAAGVFPSSLYRMRLPLDAGFSPTWVFALLWVQASSNVSCVYALCLSVYL